MIFLNELKKIAKTSRNLVVATLALTSFVACDLVSQDTVPTPAADNPGSGNTTVSADFAADATFNSYRMTSAVRENVSCGVDTCTFNPTDTITNTYDGSNFLQSSVTTSTTSPTTVRKQYFYDLAVGGRLDKYAEGEGNGTNFTTMYDYDYTNASGSDNGSNKVEVLFRCDMGSVDLATATAFVCDRMNANAATYFVYYANGYLYRKDFDTDNDTEIEHQNVYIYNFNNQLIRINVDYFYDGFLDNIATLSYDALGLSQRLYDDNVIFLSNTGIDLATSYQRDEVNNVVRECYYPHASAAPACIDDDEFIHTYQWRFVWEAGTCWAGGLDDIDPETRAIEYLCRNSNN